MKTVILNQFYNELKIFFKWYFTLGNEYPLFYLFTFVFVFLLFQPVISRHRKKRKVKKLARGACEVTPEEFFKIRKSSENYQGVYILLNKTKNMYYVGQAIKIYDRVNQHFTGHGNGDVYADWKYGDEFTIKLIPLKRSGFKTLNELERNTISAYNAFSKGYNKTRGNRG